MLTQSGIGGLGMQTQSPIPYAITVGESLRVSMTISSEDGTMQSVARLKVTVRVKLSLN